MNLTFIKVGAMSGCPPFMKLGFEFDITFQKSCINGTFHAQVSNEIAFYA